MRSWFTWLLMFGVIAGLCGRVLSLDHSHSAKDATKCVVHHQGCDSDHDHEHSHDPTDDHSHDGCPPGPHEHHTHACCHPAPLAGAEGAWSGLVPPGSSWLGVTWSTALPPDEPVFALDKPPLI